MSENQLISAKQKDWGDKMASTKRTRQALSRGFETINLKDLQYLQKRNSRHQKIYKPKPGYMSFNLKFKDSNHLLCEETLDDFDDMLGSKVSKLSESNARRNPNSQTSADHSTLSGNTLPTITANMPEPGQSTSNPYITYLIHSWDEAKGAAALKISTSVNDTPLKTYVDADQQHLEEKEDWILLNPDDVLVIPGRIQEKYSTSAYNIQSNNDEQCVPKIDSEEQKKLQPYRHGEDSLFIEDGFTPAHSCHLDHVVPKFDCEE